MIIILSRFHKRNACNGENILFLHMRVCVHGRVSAHDRMCACEYARECMWDCDGMCAILSMHKCAHVHVNAAACE